MFTAIDNPHKPPVASVGTHWHPPRTRGVNQVIRSCLDSPIWPTQCPLPFQLANSLRSVSDPRSSTYLLISNSIPLSPSVYIHKIKLICKETHGLRDNSGRFNALGLRNTILPGNK